MSDKKREKCGRGGWQNGMVGQAGKRKERGRYSSSGPLSVSISKLFGPRVSPDTVNRKGPSIDGRSPMYV